MTPEHNRESSVEPSGKFVLIPTEQAYHREDTKVPDEVCIDFAGVNSEQEVHELFARSLPFPAFYGYNWDAFRDVLTGFNCFPRRLVLSSTVHLRAAVPQAYDQLQSCFAECQREHPDIAPEVIWR